MDVTQRYLNRRIAPPKTSSYRAGKLAKQPLGKRKPAQSRLQIHDMERVTGIEPASRAWKALVLPLNYTRMALTGDYVSKVTATCKYKSSNVEATRRKQRVYLESGSSVFVYPPTLAAPREPLGQKSHIPP